jgi:two-component system NtrC family sensor kinase
MAAELLLINAEQAFNKTITDLIPALNFTPAQVAIFREHNKYGNFAQSHLHNASSTEQTYHLELHNIPTDHEQNTIIGCLYNSPDKASSRPNPEESEGAQIMRLSSALLHSLNHALAINRNLTTRLQHSNRQILQSEKMAGIGQLAAGVAHEINNPLGFVFSNMKTLSGYIDSLFKIIDIAAHSSASQVLQEAMAGLEYDYIKTDLAELLAESEDGLQRVKKIIVSLKDFSHIDEEAFAPADLHKCIETTLSVAQNEIKYKAEIIREFGELPLIDCIASQINQVVMNLTVNAAHAIEEFGAIHIRTGSHDGKAWIEIEDNGAGIPEHIISRIFEPFYTTKPIGKGTGLGLSLSQTIIEKHSGLLEVASTLGRGTKFKIWLPINQEK